MTARASPKAWARVGPEFRRPQDQRLGWDRPTAGGAGNPLRGAGVALFATHDGLAVLGELTSGEGAGAGQSPSTPDTPVCHGSARHAQGPSIFRITRSDDTSL